MTSWRRADVSGRRRIGAEPSHETDARHEHLHRSDQGATPSVLERFTAHPVGDIGVSVITLAELEYGVSKSSRPARNRAALEQFVSPLEVAAFDRDAAAVYGRVRTVLEKKGQPFDPLDLLIAAHAISLDVRRSPTTSRSSGKCPACGSKTGLKVASRRGAVAAMPHCSRSWLLPIPGRRPFRRPRTSSSGP